MEAMPWRRGRRRGGEGGSLEARGCQREREADVRERFFTF